MSYLFMSDNLRETLQYCWKVVENYDKFELLELTMEMYDCS